VKNLQTSDNLDEQSTFRNNAYNYKITQHKKVINWSSHWD